MSQQLHTYHFTNIPDDLQLGDTGYYASTMQTTSGGLTTGSDVIDFGLVYIIDRNSFPQEVTFIINSTTTPPAQGQYIMFGKNKSVDSSSLLGYYAEVKFENQSKDFAELFSVGSEVSESSK